MNIHVVFRHMSTSLAAYAYAERKLGAVAEAFGNRVTALSVTLGRTSNRFEASAQVSGAGFALHLTASDGLALNAAVDRLADKVDAALARRKDRLIAFRHEPVAIAPPLETEQRIDASEILDFERRRRALCTGIPDGLTEVRV